MFDEQIATLIKTDGTVEHKRWLAEDTMQAEVMQEACADLVRAERKIQKLNANPDCVTDPKLNLEWWESLETVSRAERKVWRLFVGPRLDLRSNMQYAKFRTALLKGENLKADA